MTDVEFETGITKITYIKAGDNASLHGGQYKCMAYGRVVRNINGIEVALKNVTFLFCSPHDTSQCEVFYTNEEGYYAIDIRPTLYRFKFICPPGYVLSANNSERGCNERALFFNCKTVPECTCQLPGTIVGKFSNCSDPYRAGLKNKNIAVSLTPGGSLEADENGHFRFDNLTPDLNYSLTFHNREINFRYMNPNETNTFLGKDLGTIKENATIVVDQPLCEFGAINGTVWRDDNANGVRDPGENTPIPNIKVCLYKCNGVCVNTETCSTTSQEGTYFFNRLEPGRYAVQFAAESADSTHSVLHAIIE